MQKHRVSQWLTDPRIPSRNVAKPTIPGNLWPDAKKKKSPLLP